jgi:hypothetical protein
MLLVQRTARDWEALGQAARSNAGARETRRAPALLACLRSQPRMEDVGPGAARRLCSCEQGLKRGQFGVLVGPHVAGQEAAAARPLLTTWGASWAGSTGDAVRDRLFDFQLPPLAIDARPQKLTMPVPGAARALAGLRAGAARLDCVRGYTGRTHARSRS